MKIISTGVCCVALICLLASCTGGTLKSYGRMVHVSFSGMSGMCGPDGWYLWYMRNTSSGSTTKLACSVYGKGAAWGCYTSSGGGVGAIAEVDYYKTDRATYWNPGFSQNLKWFLYNDPVYGWKPIISYVVNDKNAYLDTIYYYSIPVGGPGEPLFQDATDTRIGWLSIKQYDNTCQPYPGAVPSWPAEYVDGGYQYTNGPWRWLTGQWSNSVNVHDSIPCDGTVDYCGPAISLTQHEGSYDNYTVGTKEKWWFANDPAGRWPFMLMKVEQTEFDGSPNEITIETSNHLCGAASLDNANSACGAN